MPYPFRRGRAVTRTRYVVNARTQERSQPDTVEWLQCAYDAGSTTAPDDGSSVTQSPRVFGPYDADVKPDDEITIVGVEGTFQVDGDVLRHRNDLTGREHCCEIKLIRKRGKA